MTERSYTPREIKRLVGDLFISDGYEVSDRNEIEIFASITEKLALAARIIMFADKKQPGTHNIEVYVFLEQPAEMSHKITQIKWPSVLLNIDTAKKIHKFLVSTKEIYQAYHNQLEELKSKC